MSSQDEVFGLPFLFTEGLPNSLEKFTEGNLRCFLIYLIEVVGKANRQNVWQKPAWWKSKLIPYSPIKVDTARVPQDQVVKELRGLIESCYQFYRAEKILEVSKQLAEIPRILLGIRDNQDNTMTVYDTNSKAVYVTVRPENLYYDAKSLNKVSKDWRSNYTNEDGTFCEIKKAFKVENKKVNMVIEVSDSSDEDCKRELKETKKWSTGNSNGLHSSNHKQSDLHYMLPGKPPPSMGVVIKCGNDLVISLTDSDEEGTQPNCIDNKVKNKYLKESKVNINDELGRCEDGEQDVKFVCEFNLSRPCPKRFKNHPKNAVVSDPGVIILSDSDDDPEDTGICISSYTSLAKNFSNMKFYIESPPKNVQKSILGPLICSPRKDLQTHAQVEEKRTRIKCQDNSGNIPLRRKRGLAQAPLLSDDDDDILKPTKEELYLRNKKNRTFYSTPSVRLPPEPPSCLIANTQSEFMNFLGMKEVNRRDNDVQVVQRSQPNFVRIVKSMKGSLSRMPLEWLQALRSNHIVVSKRSQRTLRHVDLTKITYEPHCSTDKSFIEYNIKSSNASVGKERRTINRQSRRVGDKTLWTIEKWWLQSEEGSQRSKRAAFRMLRSLCSGEHATAPRNTLSFGSLVPTLLKLPDPVFEQALHSTINLKDTF